MKTFIISVLAATFVTAAMPSPSSAHGGEKNVKLHVNPKWSECSFQLDPSLTQSAWRQFTEEGGLVTYFRSLTGAKPIGAGNYEFSVMQWKTGIDDTDPAWNDTFVHPDSAHWLFEGSGLAFPGLSFRAGVTGRIDVGLYFTKNPNANYGFWGGQVQYNILDDKESNWATSARGSFVTMFGPDDLGMTVLGLDLLASREYSFWSDWIIVSPYAGVSTYLANTHETSAVVDLEDEHTLGVQAMVGAVAQLSVVRLSAEYNVAKVNSLSFKVGVAF